MLILKYMKRLSSLKNARKRHKDIQVVRRGKRIVLIIKTPNCQKYKAIQ